MRHVKKNGEPQFLKDWKSQENESWKAIYSNLSNPTKRDVHSHLLVEQGWTCCYCGREIEIAESHIEHFRPQGRSHNGIDLSVDYENIFASCIRETKPGAPLHCGHLKNEWFEEDCFISPLEENCESEFAYTLEGQIIPDTQRGKKMISILGLSERSLDNRRKKALALVFDATFISSATNEELSKLIARFKVIDSDTGRHDSFFQVLYRFAENLMKP